MPNNQRKYSNAKQPTKMFKCQTTNEIERILKFTLMIGDTSDFLNKESIIIRVYLRLSGELNRSNHTVSSSKH